MANEPRALDRAATMDRLLEGIEPVWAEALTCQPTIRQA